jgi:hypothetical protein
MNREQTTKKYIATRVCAAVVGLTTLVLTTPVSAAQTALLSCDWKRTVWIINPGTPAEYRHDQLSGNVAVDFDNKKVHLGGPILAGPGDIDSATDIEIKFVRDDRELNALTHGTIDRITGEVTIVVYDRALYLAAEKHHATSPTTDNTNEYLTATRVTYTGHCTPCKKMF